MFKVGLYNKLSKPDYAIALHDNPYLKASKIGYREVPFLTWADMIDRTVFGQGRHGSSPHGRIYPIVLDSKIIMNFQTIVGIEINPLYLAFIAARSIHGKTVHQCYSQ